MSENPTASTRRVRFAVTEDDDEDNRIRATGPTASRLRSLWDRRTGQLRRPATMARANPTNMPSATNGSQTGEVLSSGDPPLMYFHSAGGYRMEVAFSYPDLVLDAGTEYEITWIGPAWNDFYMSVPNSILRGAPLEAMEDRVQNVYSRNSNAIVSLDSLGLFKRGMPCAVFNHPTQKWRRAIVMDEAIRAIRFVDYGRFRQSCQEADVKPMSVELATMSHPLYNHAFVSAIQDPHIPSYHDFPCYVNERKVSAVVLNHCAPFEVMLKVVDAAKYASEKWNCWDIDDRPRAQVVDVDTVRKAEGEFAAKCATGYFERIGGDAGLIFFEQVQRVMKFRRDFTRFHGEPMDKVENLNRVFKPRQKAKFNVIKATDNGDSADDLLPFLITDIRTIINDEDKYFTSAGIITYVGKSDATILVRGLGEYVWASKRAFPPRIAANNIDDLDELIELGTHVIVRAVKSEEFYDILVPAKWIAVAVEIQCDKIDRSVPSLGVDVFKLDRVTEFPILAEQRQLMENVRNGLRQSHWVEEEEKRIREQMRIEEETRRREAAERARANDPFMGFRDELDVYFSSPSTSSTSTAPTPPSATGTSGRRPVSQRGGEKMKIEAGCQTNDANPTEQLTADLFERAKIEARRLRTSRDESTMFNELFRSRRELAKKIFEEDFGEE